MTPEVNPYESPQCVEPLISEYEVTTFHLPWSHPERKLLQTIEERVAQGWRLVCGYALGGETPNLVWHWEGLPRQEGFLIPQYRVITLPTCLERLLTFSFRSQVSLITEELAKLEPRWTFVTHFPPVGCVVRYEPPLPGQADWSESYDVLRRLPVWWRTLFGDSWIPFLSDELNDRPQGIEVVGYLGYDQFLVRSRRMNEPGAATPLPVRTYRLAMWRNYMSLVIPLGPKISSWFDEQSSQGWKLRCHYAGAIYLFESYV